MMSWKSLQVTFAILRDCEKPCDTPVSCFIRYALYHTSYDTLCIMLHAICLVSCFMRYALYHVLYDTLVSYSLYKKPILYNSLALGHI